ncbi:MAG: hypothetical protein K2Q12_05370 [Rickettsiales bacterium]|nr:hypothetical protein [Rickettsiales bacterium]
MSNVTLSNVELKINDGKTSFSHNGVDYTLMDPDQINWQQQETRWRGGKAHARHAQAGEVFVKRDGTQSVAKGGDVAILKKNGAIDYCLPKAIAEKSYDLTALPRNPLSNAFVTLTRIPVEAKVMVVDEPTAFVSRYEEDKGALRFLMPGDAIENLVGQINPIGPVQSEMMATRYISEAEAMAQRGRAVA